MSPTRAQLDFNKCLLIPDFTRTKNGLSGRLWLLLSTSFIPLFTLFLIRKRGESTRRLTHIDIAQRRSKGAHVVLDKGGV
jgi:hypothetical protein